MNTNNPTLNIAMTHIVTKALRPGYRSAVWVQGCPFRCPDCIYPDWRPFRPATQERVATLARHLLANPANTGLTFSGGEPMCQTSALAKLVEYVRRIRDIDIICYTEYTMSQLRTAPPASGSFSTSRSFRMTILIPLSPSWSIKMGTR